MQALLVLQDGTQFYGYSVGADTETVGEVVFNTAMTGYQEILSDPSYAGQIVTLTYPHIGNVGVNEMDNEASKIYASGLVIRDLSLISSNFRHEQSLSEYLKQQHIVAISDIDTRQLTRILRDKGAQSGCIITAKDKATLQQKAKQAQQQAKQFAGLNGLDLAQIVSCQQAYPWRQGSWQADTNCAATYSDAQLPYHVVAYDFGIKHNILRLLVDHGCKVTVVPAKTDAQTVLDLQPDGIFLSNGPGDPAACDYAIAAIQTLLQTGIPLFGICLGHQLLALACGAKTIKMKFGHHGANHPVQDLSSNKVMITAQNHGFTVDEASLPNCLQITHRSLFDNTIQGIAHQHKAAFSFQGHPEASPGPQDAQSLFAHFIDLMQQAKQQEINHGQTN